jgi:hypothetical protein
MFNFINYSRIRRLYLHDNNPGDILIKPLRYSNKILSQSWNRNTTTEVALEILAKLGAALLLFVAVPLAAVGMCIKSRYVPNVRYRANAYAFPNVIVLPPTPEETQISLLFLKHILPGNREQQNPFGLGYSLFATLPSEILNVILGDLNIRDFTSLKLTSRASANMRIPRYIARNIESNLPLWKI